MEGSPSLPALRISPDVFTAALARLGYLSLLKWARENHCSWDKKVCMSAAEGGHLELLKWARKRMCMESVRHVFLCRNWGQHRIIEVGERVRVSME